MSKYIITYRVDDDVSPHKRYYDAVDDNTALNMFEETCTESLIGSTVEVIAIKDLHCDQHDA